MTAGRQPWELLHQAHPPEHTRKGVEGCWMTGESDKSVVLHFLLGEASSHVQTTPHSSDKAQSVGQLAADCTSYCQPTSNYQEWQPQTRGLIISHEDGIC